MGASRRREEHWETLNGTAHFCVDISTVEMFNDPKISSGSWVLRTPRQQKGEFSSFRDNFWGSTLPGPLTLSGGGRPHSQTAMLGKNNDCVLDGARRGGL